MLLAKASQSENQAPIPQEGLARAREATVRIVLFQDKISSGRVEKLNGGGTQRVNAYAAQAGLGTLVENWGDTYILTHDHWEDLNKVVKAQIYTASGELAAQVDGGTFQSWIRHTDRGTMVLLLTEGLLVGSGLEPVQYKNDQSISTGDTVLITRKNPQQPDKVAFIPAVVESSTEFEGIPAYNLRSVNGDHIVRGDSGGGVWHHGQLAGNNWLTEFNTVWDLDSLKTGAKSKQYTGRSLAAQLPESIRQILSLPIVDSQNEAARDLTIRLAP